MKNLTFAHAGAACVCALLAGCAHVQDYSLRAFSSKVNAVAVVNEQVLQGTMELFPDHTATVTLSAEPSAQSETGNIALTSCMGSLRYTGTTGGSLDLRCNGGVATDLTMTLVGKTRGYGHGKTASGIASLVFGMSAQDAKAHLAVPANRQLVEQMDSGGIELR